MTDDALLRRFWSKVQPTEGCWLWTGARSTEGYGYIGVGPRRNHKDVLAHRLMWELTYGPIPNGLWVLHRCDTPSCVRPDHLFLGTHQDNMDDMKRKGRTHVGGGAAWQRAKTHCPRGHTYTGTNLYRRPGTRYRLCMECARVNQRRRREVARGR